MHYHSDIVHVLIYGISAILVINVGRIASGLAIQQGGIAKTVGQSVASVL